MPAAVARVHSIATAPSLRWPAKGASQVRCAVAPARLGRFCAARYAGGGRMRGCTSRRQRIRTTVLHRDDLQVAASAEQELEIVLPVTEDRTEAVEIAGVEMVEMVESFAKPETKMHQKMARRKKEQKTYLLAAIASSTGFTAMSAAAVIYRFVWHMPESGQIPYPEVFGTFSLAVGAAVGMEYWARWAHKALWHASLWHMHESHHKPRDGPFETNDVFAIINAVPAIGLMLYGFLFPGILPAFCFGGGLGITMFGIAYMFVHDGLVHRRFPVGPIAEVPYFQKVAAAHQLHHADLFEGVPYGLFLGPKELEDVGGGPELEKWMKQRAKSAASTARK